jgi:hypothetical protein
VHSPDRTLNDPIATCRDSAEAVRQGGKGAHSEQLREQLTEIQRSRSDFLDQVTETGEKPGLSERSCTGAAGAEKKAAEVFRIGVGAEGISGARARADEATEEANSRIWRS